MTLLILATENDDIYKILKYLYFGCSWSNYYKPMETVESLASINGLTLSNDKSKRAHLTNTANNYSLAGFISRHGFKQNIKANKTPSMTIEEAYKYVTGLCESYLVEAYPDIFSAKIAPN